VESGWRNDWHDEQALVDNGSTSTALITFGEFRLDTARRRLTRGGRRVRIQRKPLDVLIYLVSHSDRVVTRQELMEAFWPSGSHEESLTRCVSIVRKLLDDTQEPQRYIETVWGQGYRFVARVDTVDSPPSSRATSRPGPGQKPNGPRRWRPGGAAVLLAAGLIAVVAMTWLWDSADREAALPVERIAVMPMTSPSADDEWLAGALTDRLAETLARIEGVVVISRGSTAQFSSQPDPVAAGRLLGVDALLESQLERSGERVGMRSQLLSAEDGSVLWSYAVAPETTVLEPDAIVQLASSVAQRLWANLQVEATTHTVDAEAYRHYLRGRYFWNQRSKTALDEAVAAFEAALAIDPAYADAQVGLAETWLLMPLYGAVPPTQAIPRARQAAIRALELDARSAQATAVLGVIAMQYDWDWTEAEARLREALTLDPNDATTEQWLGELYCYRLRFDECRRHLRAAAGLAPLSPVLQLLQGSPALFSGDFEAAIAAYEQARERSPGFALTRYVLGLAHAGLGQWDQAIEHYRAALPDLGLEIVGGPLVFAMARNGDLDGAKAVLLDLQELAEKRYVPPSKLAIAWLGLGDRTRTLQWLDRAIDVHDDRLVYLAVDAHFRELHRDPKFRIRGAKVGLLDLLDTP
jgi:DNA-binding winged helix-turn-helix (wHTH) protein/TolB-like protein